MVDVPKLSLLEVSCGGAHGHAPKFICPAKDLFSFVECVAVNVPKCLFICLEIEICNW
jgi:hypothetical protein